MLKLTESMSYAKSPGKDKMKNTINYYYCNACHCDNNFVFTGNFM